jgi:hypothetical protein
VTLKILRQCEVLVFRNSVFATLGLLGCDNVLLDLCMSKFLTNVLPSSSGLTGPTRGSTDLATQRHIKQDVNVYCKLVVTAVLKQK